MKLLPLLLLILPAVVQAEFAFTTNNGTITITGYTGSNGVVTVPNTIDGLPVASIGDWAFYGTGVTNVLIADTVTNIGDGVFFDCESLTNVTSGNRVTAVGDWAFGFCPNLASVCFRGNAPNLGGNNVFSSDATSVYYLLDSVGWGAKFGMQPTVLWNPDLPYNYITNEGNITITKYTRFDEVVTISSSINFLPVVNIGDSSFSYGSLAEVQIPATVTNIGDRAFAGTALNAIAIPNGVVHIGVNAFNDCYSLQSASIPGSVLSIGDGAFDSTILTNLTLPEGVKSVGSNAFMMSFALTQVTLPDSLTNLGASAFAGCPELTNIIIPNGITIIPENAFNLCTKLESVIIPKTVTTIGKFAFEACDALASVTIPASVTNIGTWAFGFCDILSEVYFEGDAPSAVGSDVFYGCPEPTVYYLAGTAGWETSFSDVLTALWLPQIQTGVQEANGYTFTFTWASGHSVVVEACTNLFNPDWQSVQTNTLTTGTAYFGDQKWTPNFGQ